MKQYLSALCCACLLTAAAHATIHTVQVSDFVFSPATGMTVALGDTVNWVWVSGTHTTTSGTIPSGAASWDSPINSSTTSYMYKPTVAGTYNYVCTFHASMGMVGSFTVTTPTNVNTVVAANVFKLAPNPATSALHIELLQGTANLTITDATGKTVYAQQISGKQEVPVTTFANGVYFVRVDQEGQQAIERIVIAH